MLEFYSARSRRTFTDKLKETLFGLYIKFFSILRSVSLGKKSFFKNNQRILIELLLAVQTRGGHW